MRKVECSRFTQQDVLAIPRTVQTALAAYVVWFVRSTASFTVSFENSPCPITNYAENHRRRI